MQAFRFKDEDALQALLHTGLIPPELSVAPVVAVRKGDELYVCPADEDSWRDEVTVRLREVGAPRVRIAKTAGELVEACCWVELLTPSATGEPEIDPGPVLFLVPSESSMLAVAGELLRLGCTQQSFSVAGKGRALIRAVAPPYYTLARAFDTEGGLRAYRPLPGGHERIWIEIGFAHPMAEELRVGHDSTILIERRAPWTRFKSLAWIDMDEKVDFIVPEAARLEGERTLGGRIEVRTRLAPSRRGEAPSLWVLRDKAVEQVESLVEALPQAVLSRVLFAVSQVGDSTVVVLKSRPGLGGGLPPAIEVRGEAYVPHGQLRHLFLPEDTHVEPPLRRDQLRELFAPKPDHVVWLRSLAGRGDFQPETIAEAAFSPLEDWVDYVIDRGMTVLEPWVRSSLFELDSYELADVALVSIVRARKSDEGRQREHEEGGEEHLDELSDHVETPEENINSGEGQRSPIPRDDVLSSLIVTPNDDEAMRRAELQAELETLERRYMELPVDMPGDAKERQDLWLTMAMAKGALGQRTEAGHCWTRAIWEVDEKSSRALVLQWAEAELAFVGGVDSVASIMEGNTPTRDDTRAVAAFVVSVQAERRPSSVEPEQVALWQQWLLSHEENLDIRSLWLSRCALSELATVDRLGLARCRDRLLSRLRHGISPEREVPLFMRRSEGNLRSASYERMAAELERLLERVVKIRRQRSASEAEPRLTFGYVRFLLSFAMARLGHAERAHELAEKASERFDTTDPIHAFLVRAFNERIRHALDGLSPETPLSPALAAELNQLERYSRYKVDRLRQASEILEPQERLDPWTSFVKDAADPRGEEFTRLRGLADEAELAGEIEALCALADAESTTLEERVRLYDGVMDFFPHLAESQVVPILTEMVVRTEGIEPPRRAQLLEEALMLAGHFGQEALVEEIVGVLCPIITNLGSEHASKVAATLGEMLRTLRRVGLQNEAKLLLDALVERARGKGTELLLLRLQLGAAHAFLGHDELASSVFHEAFATLGRELLPPERLQLCRAVARAFAAMPQDQAIAGLRRLEEEQLPIITDSYDTNTHFCLSVVHFLESLILGYANEELTIGLKVRQMLDEEEYLIRRRIHRDMKRGSRG